MSIQSTGTCPHVSLLDFDIPNKTIVQLHIWINYFEDVVGITL